MVWCFHQQAHTWVNIDPDPCRYIQYSPRNMHTVFALLCFVVVIHWLIFPYPPGLLHWHCGNLTIAPVPAKKPWWIWINTSCEFIMNDCITTTKQSTTKPCAYFLGYTVAPLAQNELISESCIYNGRLDNKSDTVIEKHFSHICYIKDWIEIQPGNGCVKLIHCVKTWVLYLLCKLRQKS